MHWLPSKALCSKTEYCDGALLQVVEMYSPDNESTICRKTFHCKMGYCVGANITPGLRHLSKHICYESVNKKHDGKHNKCDDKNDDVK